MKYEDIDVDEVYYYDNTSDPAFHGRKIKVTEKKKERSLWPIKVTMLDTNTTIGLDPFEISQFPIGTKHTFEELDHEYRDRLRNAAQKLEGLAASSDGKGENFARLEGKIEGVKLALSYWEEMNR